MAPFQLHLQRLRLLLRIKRLQNEAMVFMSLILKPMPDIYRNMRSSSAANESISVQLSGVATSMVCARQQQVFSSVPGSFSKK